MLQILEFIVRACGFLLVGNRYRFVDSAASSSFGGDAYVVLQSTALKVRFVRDRGQLFLDFQAPSDRSASSWYSIDVVRRLLAGGEEWLATMDLENAGFVEDNLGAIEELFSSERIADTRRELRKLEKLRSREIFLAPPLRKELVAESAAVPRPNPSRRRFRMS